MISDFQIFITVARLFVFEIIKVVKNVTNNLCRIYVYRKSKFNYFQNFDKTPTCTFASFVDNSLYKHADGRIKGRMNESRQQRGARSAASAVRAKKGKTKNNSFACILVAAAVCRCLVLCVCVSY